LAISWTFFEGREESWIGRSYNSDFIADLQSAVIHDLGKDAFLGHYAVAGLFVDLAFGMAFFADLGDFQLNLARLQPGADRQPR